MTFDLIALAVFVISGLLGFARGATREVTTLAAFILAAMAAVLGRRYASPIAHHWIHTGWLANVTAILVLFIVVYTIVRLIGGALTRGVRQTRLSGLDRALGLGIGLARAVVAIGLFALLIDAATPPERMPRWLTHAAVYPVADASAETLRALTPRGVAVAHAVGPMVEHAVTDPGEDEAPSAAGRSDPAPEAADGRTHNSVEVVVEKPR